MRRVVGALVVAFLLAACGSDPNPEPAGPSDENAGITVRDVPCPQFPDAAAPVDGGLPALQFPCLTSRSALSLGGPVGQPLVLNLWASWCAPCREELPFFDRLHAQARDALLVVGLVERDTSRSSLSFYADLDLSFPSALDETGAFLTEIGRNALPVTYFVRADGTVAHEQLIPLTSYDELAALVAEHLAVTVP